MSRGLRVGPAGNSEIFYEQGYKSTADAFAWQRRFFGLDAFEVPFGRGISMSMETAAMLGCAAREADVEVSAHAPYYVNLANPDEALAAASARYLTDSARLTKEMGGTRLVVHVGSPKGGEREDALERCAGRLLAVRDTLERENLGDIRLCLETMGRPSVLGTLEEVLYLVRLHRSFLPCLDFAHLHAAQGGMLNTEDDFARVLDRVEAALGATRAQEAHIHFSRIEFGPKGEIRHRVFADDGFGPDFTLLAPLLAARGYAGTLICESRGTMAQDAAQMKRALADAHAGLKE